MLSAGPEYSRNRQIPNSQFLIPYYAARGNVNIATGLG